jgi:hypothetical protein
MYLVRSSLAGDESVEEQGDLGRSWIGLEVTFGVVLQRRWLDLQRSEIQTPPSGVVLRRRRPRAGLVGWQPVGERKRLGRLTSSKVGRWGWRPTDEP